MNLQYTFVNLSVNGKKIGIFALEEHFEKRLLERQGQKEGPILKLNEDITWHRIEKIGPGTPYAIPLQSINETHVDIFKQGKTLHNPTLKKNFIRASGLLNQFITKKRSASEVFNVEKTATFMAVSDLFGAQHSRAWHNMRFYYNPITSKLEPIGFDANAGKQSTTLAIANPELPFWNDPTFVKAYVKQLEILSQPEFLNNLLQSLEPEMSKEFAKLHKDYPHIGLPIKFFKAHQNQIRAALHPHSPLLAYSDLIPNTTHQSPQQLHLEIGNTQIFPIHIHGIYQGKTKRYEIKQKNIPGRQLKSHPAFQLSSGTIKGKIASFKNEDEYEKWVESLTIKYSLAGSKEIQSQSIIPYRRYNKDFLKDDTILNRNLNQEIKRIAVINESEGTIRIKPGPWTLTKTAIIPEGYTVTAGPGTTITLRNNASLISRSPLRWIGKRNASIRIKSESKVNSGLFVLNTEKESILDYVIISGLSAPEQANWGLTGAVSFYEAPVSINHTIFVQNNSEDALNITRSPFTIKNSRISHTTSDALDADFSNGTITNLTITHSGNDGIDVSGSTIKLRNITIANSRDKAISAGENSHLTGQELRILNSEIGITSKDLSSVKLTKVTMTNTKVGYALFQKKPEFGPAQIAVTNSAHENIERLYLMQPGSSLEVNTDSFQANAKDVEALLYGNIYGKETVR